MTVYKQETNMIKILNKQVILWINFMFYIISNMQVITKIVKIGRCDWFRLISLLYDYSYIFITIICHSSLLQVIGKIYTSQYGNNEYKIKSEMIYHVSFNKFN